MVLDLDISPKALRIIIPFLTCQSFKKELLKPYSISSSFHESVYDFRFTLIQQLLQFLCQ